MNHKKMQVTLIGLGKIGSAIAKMLLKANFELTVYNRSPDKILPLVKLGALGARSLTEAVRGADIVITSLLDDNAVLQMVNGSNGFLSAMKPGAIHIGTSTVLPSTAKKLQALHEEHKSIYVSGNVLGVPSSIEAKMATSIVAGPLEAVNLCAPIFNAYSTKIINVAANAHKANVLKICTNYLLTTAIEAMGELYVFAEKSGLEAEALQGLFHSVFAHPAFLLYVDKVKQRDFDTVNFALQGGLKDLNLFQQAFTEVGAVADIASLVKNKFISAIANGLQDKDWSAVTEITRMQAGIK